MPPKKKQQDAKLPDKAKQKVVEDKTFGLKNKKGKKQQTYIKNVATQVQGNVKKDAAATAAPKLTKRELEKQKLEELNALFKPVQKAQVVAAGVDPKSVLCTYFKQGTCQKGNRCKFSHDLSIERKCEKRSLYADERDEKEKDSMNDWDQQMLEDVVNKKHGTSNTNKTDIVCKYFLDAVEKNLYGWFWNCPNGENCMYRHALPPGFILKKDQKKEDESEKISLEEHIEKERNDLSGILTPVTMETFLAWKKRKIDEKKDKHNQEMNKKEKEFKAGKGMLKISGKEVFMFKPELADADDEEADDDIYNCEEEDDDEREDVACVEINLESFAQHAENSVANSHITQVSTLLARDRETAHAPTSHDDGAGGVAAAAAAASNSTNSNDVEIDESLFEDFDDLDLEDGD